MKFNNIEEVKKWFMENKYPDEVHKAIEFLIKENEKIQQERDNLSKQLFRISETVRCRICGELQTQCRCFIKPNDHVF
jgi:hypothetical protein